MTHQNDPPTKKRDEWKASTGTEGDSKAPSASTATSTCRRAGARGKHAGNVVTTPGSVRGEEKSLEQAPGNRPEERMGPKTLPHLSATARAEAGQPQSRNRKQPDGKIPSSALSKNPGVTKTPKGKEQEKSGGKLPSRRTN